MPDVTLNLEVTLEMLLDKLSLHAQQHKDGLTTREEYAFAVLSAIVEYETT